MKAKMPKTSCEIVFKNNNTTRVFYGGDTIKGSVVLTLHSEKIVKSTAENPFQFPKYYFEILKLNF